MITPPPIPENADPDRAQRVAELVERMGWDPAKVSANHPVFFEPAQDEVIDGPEAA